MALVTKKKLSHVMTQKELEKIDSELLNEDARHWQVDVYLRLKKLLSKELLEAEARKFYSPLANTIRHPELVRRDLATLEEEKIKYGF